MRRKRNKNQQTRLQSRIYRCTMRLSLAVALLGATTSTLPRVIAAKHHAVTGVYVDPRSGSVPTRQNINDLEAAGGPQW